MEGLKRTKATKAQKRHCKPVGKAAFKKMATAASEIVMRNRGRQYRDGEVEYVLLEHPHWCEFADDFPKGFIQDRTPLYNTRKINAIKLLDWLHKHGHTPYNSATLVKQTKAYEYLAKGIDRMFEE